MKSFKDFILENKSDKKNKKPKGIIPEPIHFKDVGKSNKKGTIPEPIHFKHVKEESKPIPHVSEWESVHENGHLGDNHNDVTKNLARGTKFTPEEKSAVRDYTEYSKDINYMLIKRNGVPHPNHQNSVDKLDSAINSNKIKKDMVVYSGVKFNPNDIKDENGMIRSPAYISATHNKSLALDYVPTQRRSHLLAIHLKAGHPAAHISKVSVWPHEGETLIGRNSTFRHIGKKRYDIGEGRTVTIHHVEAVQE